MHLNDAELICPLCEWENTPLTADGAEDRSTARSEDINSGISIAMARTNFGRYLSMYDPAKPEPWMLGPPSRDVLRLKRTLHNAYKSLLAAPEHDRHAPLNIVKDCERALAIQIDAERNGPA
jgi:hypothetical protein